MTCSACGGVPVFNWIPGTNIVPIFFNGVTPNFDDGLATINVPFNYNLYGTAYNTLNVSTNGLIGPNLTTTFYGECPASAYTRRTVELFAGDILLDIGDVYTAVLGVAPNRIFAVEWRNARFTDRLGTFKPGVANFEALLYEGSSDWVFQYRVANGNFSDGTFGYTGVKDI